MADSLSALIKFTLLHVPGTGKLICLFVLQGANGPRPTYAGANNGSAGNAGGGVGVGPTSGGHGLKGGAGGGPRGGNPVQYRASGAGAWGTAPSHAAAAAATAYPPYTRYPPTAAAAAAAQIPVGQQLPPATNPYAATAYAQHTPVSH